VSELGPSYNLIVVLQSISGILMDVEYYIVTYPARTVLFLAAICMIFFVVVKRIVGGDVTDIQEQSRKGNRLD
jgi:hypothetical protein